MLAERLAKAWDARRGSAPADLTMRFDDDGLVLGVGTVLAPAGATPRDVRVDPRDPRLAALLAAAHRQPPTGAQLAHLAKAAERRRDGEDALAAMHLALSGLARLARPDGDAHRLFLADGLIEAGADPATVLAALEPLAKFDADQPRVPAGSGRPSGQWTSGNATPASAPTPAGVRPAAASARSDAAATAPSSLVNPSQPEVNPSTLTSAVDRPAPQADTQSPLVYPPPPEVNPSTVTEAAAQQYANPYACDIAQAHCVTAAIDAAEDDAANDNLTVSKVDLSNCRNAGSACKIFSWITHNIPFLDGGGGVIFPGGGVVLIGPGAATVDRYVPPPVMGGRGSLR